ncbi:hypothetical protein [Legionella brunensis]|uniref:Uncharacterized protein n=1 Tax=Legionella brunensis TaxID=29422 RepID=A0A0W0STG0_9GAMM|nr:hypothetical protein [Legionella brunensis]KTC86521.1 hypothetical protein Lbru_0462 [Legionella brunensis]
MPLKDAINNADKVLVVGYSPTGGGHTGRTFSIIEQALKDGHLHTNDAVIFHCPPKWENIDRPELNRITNILQEKGIQVVFSVADKSVYGYLKKDGSSDDAKILDRFAHYPERSKNQNSDIIECGALWPSSQTENQSNLLPTQFIYSEVMPDLTISAKHLMQSLSKELQNKNDKIYVLTDMDPYLQKAAIEVGVPPQHCLDQQNHAILLHDEKNFLGSYALLAKVLSASGGKISHMELGDKNTLSTVEDLMSKLGISKDTSKEQAKKLVIDVLHCNGARIDLKKEYSSTKAGVMWPENLKPQDVKQVVYIYAHASTPAIGEHIRKKIESNDPNYTNKVFLFCGQGAIQGKNYNAMHMAYIAEADGITTAGAGTTGEFTYLHTKANDNSRLLVLPIHGHNEQKANAQFIANKFEQNVLYEEKKDVLALVDQLVNLPLIPEPSPDKSKMDVFFKAITDKETYSKQASEILFENVQHTQSETLNEAEKAMRKDPGLRVNRRYIKAVFQLLSQIEEKDVKFPVKIQIKQDSPPKVFRNIDEIVEFFQKDEELMKTLETRSNLEETKAPEFVLRDKVVTFFQKCPTLSSEEKYKEAEALKEEFGSDMTTGF